jgi:hypothetical protein
MEYNMYVNDNLYAQVGQERMRQAMRCSIHTLNVVMGGPDPKARPNPTNLDKFLCKPVSHHHRQVGYVVDTCRMIVMIKEDKRKAMVKVLSMTQGEHHHSFTLIEAARLLGTLISLCRVCHWGIFLFTNLYQAMYETLGNNARRLMSSPEYRELVHQCDVGVTHPTDNTQFCFFSSKVAQAIWNCKAWTFIKTSVREELRFFTARIQRSNDLQLVSSHCHPNRTRTRLSRLARCLSSQWRRGFLLQSTVLLDGRMVTNNHTPHNSVPVQEQQTLGIYNLLQSTVLLEGRMVANNHKPHNLVPVQGQQTLGLYQCPRIRCHHFWA